MISAKDLAVVTIVAGRHQHLRRQLAAVAALDPPPKLHVVVGMGDPGLPAVVASASGTVTRFVELPVGERLPLSAARNRGVAVATAHGALAVALLDVDCIPEPSLAGDYAAVLTQLRSQPGPVVVSGRVRYLPEGMTEDEFATAELELLGADNRLRVVPETDHPVPGEPWMVWSLNLGVTVEDWDAIGGFDERYEGYGGEDTDFGQRLSDAGGGMWWTRNAGAFHQWHAVSRPPVEHVADIVTNANLFNDTWGWYPMGGWLEEFERRGLVARGPEGWRRCADPDTSPDSLRIPPVDARPAGDGDNIFAPR